MDSLTEQIFGGTMTLGDNNEFYWKPNNRINIRVNQLHKAAAYLYWGHRKLDLKEVKRCLITLTRTHPTDSIVAKKARALNHQIQFLTSSWQWEAQCYLKTLVSYQGSFIIDK